MEVALPIITTIIGVVIGAVVTVLSEDWRDRKANRERGRSTRALVRQEVEHNVRYLTQIQNVCQEAKGDFLIVPAVLKGSRGEHLSSDAWISQMPHLSLAFDEEEVMSLHEFYGRLRSASAAVEQFHSYEPPHDRLGIATQLNHAADVLDAVKAALSVAPKL